MEFTEVTIKQVADECGVSKSTAVRKLKELGLPVITRGGKGTVFLGPEAASALAHALVSRRTPELPRQDEVSEILGLPPRTSLESLPTIAPSESSADEDAANEPSDIELVIASYQDQIRTLKALNDSLMTQIEHLNQTVEALRSNYESTVSILSDQIDRLGDQVTTMQKEKDQLRDELAMSRALEGFHFPWQRDRIKSLYLLPASREAIDADDFEVTS